MQILHLLISVARSVTFLALPLTAFLNIPTHPLSILLPLLSQLNLVSDGTTWTLRRSRFPTVQLSSPKTWVLFVQRTQVLIRVARPIIAFLALSLATGLDIQTHACALARPFLT